MKRFKKLLFSAVTGLMLVGILAMPTTTLTSAESRVTVSPMPCPTCRRTLTGTWGACAIRTGSGYCFAGQDYWSCQNCSVGWYRCDAGHTNF